ncbi:MAG: ABC transporter substrate-binding protein [Acidimicrobiales bacterium]
MRRVLVVLMVIAAVAAGCTSSGDETTTETSTTPPPTVDGGGDSASTTTADNNASTTTSLAVEAVPLEATARGVTAETITLGVAQLDLQLIRDAGLADVNHGDYELIYNTLVDDINDRGGINGRMVELLYDTYDVLVPAEQEALCTKFAEDEEVFALIGGMREDNIYCITEQHEMISVGNSGINQERIDRSQGRLITPDTVAERGIEMTVAALDTAGTLDGEVVAIHGIATSSTDAEAMESALTAAGHEVALTTLTDTATGDIQAADDQFSAFAERYAAEGVTAVVIVGAVTTALDGIFRAGLDVEIYADIARSGEVSGAARSRPDETRGVIAVRPALPEGPEQTADPLLAQCIDTFEAANPDVAVPEMRSVEPGDEDWAIGIRIACTHMMLFELAAVAAGPVLDNDTFLAAAEGLGDIALPTQPYVSFGPGKLDGNDGAQLAEWDPDDGPSGNYIPISELVDTTP